MNIFHLSQSQCVMITCFKQITIVPVPKNSKVTCNNECHSIAFTSVTMRRLESLVRAHINFIIPNTLDPLQLAYCPNRFTDYAMMNKHINATCNNFKDFTELQFI
jgi:hypothetical protein